MERLTYSDYLEGNIKIKEEDLQEVLRCFEEEIEMEYDELGHIYNEAGVYFADLDIERYEIRSAKVQVRNPGGNASKGARTYSLTLPAVWMKEIGITDDERDVKLKYENGKITIERLID